MADSWPVPKPGVPVAMAIIEDADDGAVVSDEVPDPRPAEFYVVSQIGYDYSNPVFSVARVLVECWALDSSRADEMARNGVVAFKNARHRTFAGAKVISCLDVQGPQDYNDPSIQDRRRSQFHGSLQLRT